MRRWLTVDQAAEALGLHRSTVIRQIGEGTITGARRVGRQWRIPAAAVAAPSGPAPAAGALAVSTLDGWLTVPALEAALRSLAAALAAADRAEARHKIGSPEAAAAHAVALELAAKVSREAAAVGLLELLPPR